MSGLSRRHAFIRTLAWSVYGLMLASAVLVHASGLPDATKMRLGDALLYLLPIAAALVGALWLGRRTNGVERRLWLLIAGVSVLVLLSEIYFTWYATTIDARGPEYPGVFQALQLLAVVLGVWVMATMTTFGSAPLRSVFRFACDVFGGLIVVATVCYWFFILPVFRTVAGATWQAAAVSAIYPVVGLMIVVVMSLATGRWRTYHWRSWERLIAAAFLLYGAGLMVSPMAVVQMREGSDPQGSILVTAALGFGYYLLVMAIVYRLTAPKGEGMAEPWFFPRRGPVWFPAVYPVLLAAALPVIGIAALRIGEDPQGIPVTIAAVTLAVLLVVRSWLASSERALHSLSASTDSVSGAYNYRYLKQRLAQDLVYSQAAGAQIAVITIGIDGLSSISHVGGRTEADRVIAAAAAAIRGEAHGDTTLCRAAGDTYVVIARGLGVTGASELAQRVVETASRSVKTAGAQAGFSAGIAVSPAHGSLADDLIVHSGEAQVLAGSREGGGVATYDAVLVAGVDPASLMAGARARSRRSTTRALAAAVDARDPDTRRHSENVADLASGLALVLGLSAESATVLELAARMHDVGKVGIPDAVLHARGILDEAQREKVEQHPVLGERIVDAARLDEILPAVRHHHERWDGTGYPDGLLGTEIPLDARILAVCDAYESMTAPRSYGGSLTAQEAIAEIELCAGTQFDPDIAAAFSRMIRQVHRTSPRDRAGRPSEARSSKGQVSGA